MRNKVILLVVAVLLTLGAVQVLAQDNVLKIGLLTDQSGPLTIYGFEQEYGFKLGLLYAAGVDPEDYASIDEAMAAVRLGAPVDGRP
ncbi:MAG: hypothetical protein U0670_24820 [Anaerolineae bacterium]